MSVGCLESLATSFEVILYTGGGVTEATMVPKDAGVGFLAAAVLSSPGGAVVAPIVVGILLAVGIMFALSRIDELDEREPPLMKSRIPYCGHLLGMLKWQVGYMQMLR